MCLKGVGWCRTLFFFIVLVSHVNTICKGFNGVEGGSLHLIQFFFWWKFCCFSIWVLFSPNPLRLGQAYSLLITNPPAVFNTQADSWWWPLLAQRFTNLTRFLLWKENTCVAICNSLLSYHHEKLSSFSSAVGLSCKQTKLDMRLLKKILSEIFCIHSLVIFPHIPFVVKKSSLTQIQYAFLFFHHEKRSSFSSACGLSSKQTKLGSKFKQVSTYIDVDKIDKKMLHTFTSDFSLISTSLQNKSSLTWSSVCCPVL